MLPSNRSELMTSSFSRRKLSMKAKPVPCCWKRSQGLTDYQVSRHKHDVRACDSSGRRRRRGVRWSEFTYLHQLNKWLGTPVSHYLRYTRHMTGRSTHLSYRESGKH